MEKSNVNQNALSAQVATFDHPIKTADESPDLHQELTTECARPNPDGQSEEPLPSDEHSKGFMPSSEHSVRSIPSQNTEKHTLTSQDDIRKNAIDQIRPMLPTQKSIIVTISNQIAIPLISPNVYLTYGKVFGLFPFKVDTGEMCCLAVNQTPGLPRGVGGCIVFQLAVDTNDKYLCVYAFDPVIGNGSFGFKWKSEIKDYKSLVMKMEEEKWDNDHSTAQRSVKSDATGYVISGTMSHDDPIHLCVEVTNSHLKDSIYMQLRPEPTSQLYSAIKSSMADLNVNSSKAVVLIVKNNLDEPLECPQTYITHGRLKGNLPLRILPSEVKYIFVQRSLLGMNKVKGIVTFELQKTGLKPCIFLYNPGIGFNRFCVKFKKQGKATDILLYKKMSSASKSQYGLISWQETIEDVNRLRISGFMSQNDPGYIQVIVDSVSNVT